MVSQGTSNLLSLWGPTTKLLWLSFTGYGEKKVVEVVVVSLKKVVVALPFTFMGLHDFLIVFFFSTCQFPSGACAARCNHQNFTTLDMQRCKSVLDFFHAKPKKKKQTIYDAKKKHD